ncbi:MAG: hypothetical protein LBN05_07505 [Oscillospiraceae bacterium]|jgi:alpha-mannosidase|nr:hypothetical protein [Oscillospiraceae bacterium]
MPNNPFNKPSIYAVATAHLDTVWNWDFETTIREYILNTLRENFALFEKYPDYVFSFEGSYRYELMEEYYPELFARLREYIQQGRWHVTGSSYENGDVNIPSAEALFRNILYGNGYFAKTFGKRSTDIFLPDCFGFGTQLPTIAAHANLTGFTTQKLTWSSSVGIPFDLGRWQGVDGSQIFASLNALSYVGRPKKFRKHKEALKKLKINREKYGLNATYMYYGTGDIGGAPKEFCVAALEKELAENSKKSVEVISASADQVFRDFAQYLTPEAQSNLPLFTGELISTNHGVGCYTSRAIGKRWNKQGEWLADAAERFAVAALWLGAQEYPQSVLDTAWKRLIAHQFHDDITGTSLARVYQRSWNDYALSLNQLTTQYAAAVRAVRRQMDDRFVRGTCVTVANPTAYDRTEVVQATIPAADGNVRVLDHTGKVLPTQMISTDGKSTTLAFLATVPASGLALFDAQPGDAPAGAPLVTVTQDTLENDKLRVKIDAHGDISEIYDKTLCRGLLTAPIQTELFKYAGSKAYPAWELRYRQQMRAPVSRADHPTVEIVAGGGVRAALKITRTAEGSTFVQTLTLDAASSVLRVENDIDWQSRERLLKTRFPLSSPSELASYDVGVGVTQRGVNTPKVYEVPAQNFADLSNAEFGVSILSDCKYGWDHPDAGTLRLTGIHTPRWPFRPESAQHELDIGRNLYAYGIFGHLGAKLSDTQKAALCFNQPLTAFVDTGCRNAQSTLPSAWGFAQLSEPGAAIRAIKKAQDGDEIIVRVQEIVGEGHPGVRLTLAAEILSVREVWASEESKPVETLSNSATLENGALVFDLAAYEPKTFALRLFAPEKVENPAHSVSLAFQGDVAVTSPQSAPADGVLGGMTIPAELYPTEILCGEILHSLNGQALRCAGQELTLPDGAQSVQLLLASVNGDKDAVVSVSTETHTIRVQDALERIATWDLPYLGDKARVKPAALAWNATHMHTAAGDVIAQQCYLFAYDFPVLPGSTTLTLPEDSDILLFGAGCEV